MNTEQIRLVNNIRVVTSSATMAANDHTIVVENGLSSVNITLKSGIDKDIICVTIGEGSIGAITILAVGSDAVQDITLGTFGNSTLLGTIGNYGQTQKFHFLGGKWYNIT